MGLKLTAVEVRDKTFETLLDKAKDKDHAGVCREAAKTLDAFAQIPVSDRILYVPVPERRELEKIFQTTIESPRDLVEKVGRLARIKVGEVEYHLAPGYAVALKTQAEFHGKSVDEWIKMTLDHIMEEVLGRV